MAQIKNIDSAFQVARTLAFSSKYNESILLCKKILEMAPKYQDIRVLLGRVYFWNSQTDSAVFILSESIKLEPYEDSYIALSDILRWKEKSLEAQKISEEGLRFFSFSVELTIRKIKALYDLGNYKEAYHLADSLLAKRKDNPALRQLTESVKRKLSKNLLTISYDYDFFNNQFEDSWQFFSASYGRQTSYFGRITGRVNLANRFAVNGMQVEMDAYPTIGKKMYAYINVGYSQDIIFPNYRSGLSIYRNFPHAFEGELGVRVLYFKQVTFLYVGSIGKYKGRFWFSFRPTFTALENGSHFFQSYSLITRYYLKTSFDYLTLTLGYGLSPNDRSKETLFQNPDLKKIRIQLLTQKLINGTSVFSISAGIITGGYHPDLRNIENEISVGMSYQKMF